MCQSGEKRVLLLVISIQFVNYSTQFSSVRQVTELLKQLFYFIMMKRIGQGFFKECSH
ncbi:hypothetical protein [Bacillus pumilus]|uniref:hypothetical protein n=1 Tax=Bacillus pumilus TaxID=1408 RepID=UPI003CEF6132